MCPGDVSRYPKEVSVKKMEPKKMNLKNLSQISETSPYTTLPFKQIGLKVVLGFCWVQGVINNLIRGNLSLADIMSASQYSLAPSEISFTTNSGPGLADGADPSLEMRIGF